MPAVLDSNAPLTPSTVSGCEPADTDLAVRVRGLIKRYRDGTAANRGIDIDVRRGEIVSVLGPNGAGKTTFLQQITTQLKPTEGTISVFGIDAIRDPQRAKQHMGITPQEAGIFESLRVREHLELFARLKGLSRHAAADAASAVLDALGLTSEADRATGTLSGGQRRRILIALALLGRPPLLVLDEPTTGLDPASRRSVWSLLQRVVSDGTSIILSTHYIEEAERLSNRIAIISAGVVIAFGTLTELLAKLHASYRLSFDDPDHPAFRPRVHRCATFAEVQTEIRRRSLSEYTVARASLEDVYFELAREPFQEADVEERP